MNIFRPPEALKLMGIICKPGSCSAYIYNMHQAGLLESSYKLNNKWVITLEDIERIKPKIMSGEYKPSSKYIKLVA